MISRQDNIQSLNKRPRPDNNPNSPSPPNRNAWPLPVIFLALLFTLLHIRILQLNNILLPLLIHTHNTPQIINQRPQLVILKRILIHLYNRRWHITILGPPRLLFPQVGGPIYKKPFWPDTRRRPPLRLPTLPLSFAPSSPISPMSRPMEDPRRLRLSPASEPLAPGTPSAERRSTRRPRRFSTSRSRRRAFSRSSLSSLSARLAASWAAESLDWSSSIVLRRLEILSRALFRSSWTDWV
ncbi:hypothetical protein BDV96DRAFT_112507 [Lophiotrema nucula]|uniref:Uncharacterized protein n=1 Tax=Lophiotrema nucula TaxID=690887 RepID=A0A6A5Z427_9PLEO|nr:hypothetical protein BDV96DRAFT_112507 [Lophiotrema nucula]